MSDSIAPVPVSDTCWLYGEREGLTVVQEYRDTAGDLIKTLTVTIPWDKVAKARGRRPMGRTALASTDGAER
jgi:hypothetical protein